MTDKEKYTLDKLMRVSSETEFRDVRVYLRTLGAKHDELRYQAAMASATRQRKALRDEKSTEYQLHLEPMSEEPIDELKKLITNYERTRLRRLSQTEIVDEREPPLPDDATITDAVDRDLEKEEIEKETLERREKWVAKALEDFTKLKFDGYDEDGKFIKPEWNEKAIKEEVKKRHSAALAERAFSDGYDGSSLLYGCFKDKKCKQFFFDGKDEADNCSPLFRRHLLDAYYDLDRFAMNMEELKN